MPTVTLPDTLRDSFRSLRHRNFRLYWWGQLVSLSGSWMQSVAQGWLMHRLTDSAFMLGLLGFAQFTPMLVLSPWAGVIIDRVDRRRLLMTTQSLALVQAVILAILVGANLATPWRVLILAFAHGCVNAFDMPARQTFVVDMVGREDLSNGIALNSAAFNGARIFGPAIAGVLVASVGEAGCFWINALTFVAVLVGLARMDIPSRFGDPARDVAASLGEGIRFAWSTRSIRNLLVLLGICSGFGFQYTILLPVYARDILHAGAGAYGLMVSAFGLGSLLAAARMTIKLSRWDLRRHLLIGLVSGGVGLAVFAFSRVLWLTLAGGFVAGFGLILYISSTNTLLQSITDDRMRGRVMGLYTLMFAGLAPFGALLAGTLGQRFGAPVATGTSATILLGGALWVSVRLRELSALEASGRTAPQSGESY